MTRTVNFEGRSISVPDDATDAEVAEIIGGGVSPAPTSQEASMGAKMMANPATRFAVGAASPILGAAEWLPGAAGKWFAENNKAIEALVEEGKLSQGEYTQILGNVAGIGGTVLSPAFLKLMKILPSAKTGMELIKQGAITGAVAGATSPIGSADIEDKALTTGGGAVLGGVATPIVAQTLRGISNIASPLFSDAAKDASVGRLAVKAAGDRAQSVATALQSGTAGQTAAQAAAPAGSSEFTALQAVMRGAKGTEFGNVGRAEEAARMANLRSVTPDMASAVSSRQAAAQPYYQKADKAVVTLDSQLSKLFDQMPKGVLEAAENIARMEGRPFQIGKYTPSQQVPTGVLDSSGNMMTTTTTAQYPKITGESLHYVKRALSDIANSADPSRGIGRDAQSAARGVLKDFVTAFENRVPDYKTARKIFADKSADVNQSAVLGQMARVLEKETGGERAAPFLNTLGRGEEALLKRSSGFARYEQGDLQKVLTPQQYDTVIDIANQLKTKADLSTREIEGMKGALKAIRASESKEVRAPNMLNYKITMINSLLNRLEGLGGEVVEKRAAEMMLPGQGRQLANVMQNAIDNPLGLFGGMTKGQAGVINPLFKGMLTGEPK